MPLNIILRRVDERLGMIIIVLVTHKNGWTLGKALEKYCD